MTTMRRPLWTYRPLLCMLGLHAKSQRRASTLVKVGPLLRPGYRLIAECDRPGCTYCAEVAPPVEVPLSDVRVIPDRIARD